MRPEKLTYAEERNRNVAKYNGNHHDPAGAPDAVACAGCGSLREWEWMDMNGSRFACWVQPHTDCLGCKASKKEEARARGFRERQISSGIPKRYQSLRLSEMAESSSDMNGEEFRRWCKHANVLGMTPGNRRAIEALRTWKPKDGSIYLQGPVGCGKTAIVCALASDMMTSTGKMTEVILPSGSTALKVDNGVRVYMTSDERLGAELRLARTDTQFRQARADHGDPTRRAIDAQVLVWDDLGTASGDKWLGDVLERLIDERYSEGRPMIITSNIRFDALDDVFSPRLVGRLAEMVGGRIFELAPDDWRRS